jgi:hypothetical protein
MTCDNSKHVRTLWWEKFTVVVDAGFRDGLLSQWDGWLD